MSNIKFLFNPTPIPNLHNLHNLRNVEYMWNNTWQSNLQWNWVFNDKYSNGRYMGKCFLTEGHGGVFFYVRLNQYSHSLSAYEFWNLVHEQTMLADRDRVYSGIPLYGNVYKVSDPEERALGYFQVSALSRKVLYVNQ